MKKFQVNYIIFCLLFNKLLVHIPLISATLRKNNLVKSFTKNTAWFSELQTKTPFVLVENPFNGTTVISEFLTFVSRTVWNPGGCIDFACMYAINYF